MGDKITKLKLLRTKAEAKATPEQITLVDPQPNELLLHKLLHEVEVHRIELEMQNEELRQSQISLEESRDHYIDFYDFAPVGYITLGGNGLISEINLTGAALLGVERNRLLKQRLARFVAPEDHDRMHVHFQAVRKGDVKQTCELLLKRGDGSCFPAQLDCLRVAKEGGKHAVRIVLTDITERKRKDESLREQEEFFRLIAENTEDFIAVLDLEGRRIYNNPTYARLFGNPESLKGTNSFAEIHPDDREHVRWVFSEIVRTGIGLRTEFRFVLADGSICYMESRGGLIRDSQGNPLRVVVVSRDITVRKLAEEEIHSLAFHDALTGLPNRRLLKDRLNLTLTASKRSGRFGALMFVDMDNFKLLNDQHGHAAGDFLLVEAARRISNCVREVDTVARFGGDEFLVLLGELDVDGAKAIDEAGFIAEKVRIELTRPYILTIKPEGKAETSLTHHCTASIGVAMFSNQNMSQNDLITCADLAMYQAKQDGRNLIRFFAAARPLGTG